MRRARANSPSSSTIRTPSASRWKPRSARPASRSRWTDAECALVYYAEDWHRGVLGIVASRLVERLHRPVFVLGRNPEDGLAQGSGRSIPAFHLLEALESMADLFVRFGGHKHAAGVTMDAARVDEFRAALQRVCRRAPERRGFPAPAGDRRRARAARDQRAGHRRALRAGAVRPRQSAAAVRRARCGSGRLRRSCGRRST